MAAQRLGSDSNSWVDAIQMTLYFVGLGVKAPDIHDGFKTHGCQTTVVHSMLTLLSSRSAAQR